MRFLALVLAVTGLPASMAAQQVPGSAPARRAPASAGRSRSAQQSLDSVQRAPRPLPGELAGFRLGDSIAIVTCLSVEQGQYARNCLMAGHGTPTLRCLESRCFWPETDSDGDSVVYVREGIIVGVGRGMSPFYATPVASGARRGNTPPGLQRAWKAVWDSLVLPQASRILGGPPDSMTVDERPMVVGGDTAEIYVQVTALWNSAWARGPRRASLSLQHRRYPARPAWARWEYTLECRSDRPDWRQECQPEGGRRLHIERPAPPRELVLRTSAGVAVPVVRPARYFNNDVSGGGSLVTDTVANAVTIAAPDDVDRTSFAVRLGALPSAVRYEADVSMPRTCEQRIAGLIFGRGEQGDRYGVVVMPSGGLLYLVRLVRFAAGGVSGLGGGVMWRDPFDTPASRRHFVVEIRGRSVSWSVGAGPPERVEVPADVEGQIGVIAGPRCTVRYENLRVTPIP